MSITKRERRRRALAVIGDTDYNSQVGVYIVDRSCNGILPKVDVRMNQKKSDEENLRRYIADGPDLPVDEWVKTSVNIPKDLLKRVKVKAILDETTLTKIITSLLEKYVESS